MNFSGFDTETIGGKAFIIATESDRRVVVSFDECASFLLRAGETCDGLVAFNADYDVRAMLAHIPRTCLWRLARSGVLDWGGYKMKWIPGKVFTLKDPGIKQQISIYDVFQFFGCSLQAAAEKHLGKQKLDPGVGWEDMDQCWDHPELMTRVGEYCQQDAFLALELMELVLSQLSTIGVRDSKPISPAYLAGRHFFGKRRHRISDWLQRIGWACYHGGRAEMFQRGCVKRAWFYDIHSAYPAVMAGMQEWDSLEYVSGRSRHPGAVYGCYLVDLDVPTQCHIGPVPMGRNLLIYPTGQFRTWVSLPSFDYLDDSGWITRVLESHELCDGPNHDPNARPLAGMADLYDLRADPALSLAAKLLMNGLSGKLAQLDETWVALDGDPDPTSDDLIEHGIGYRLERKLGAYTHYMIAAHITDTIRVALYRAMTQDPDAIVSCATDGIISTRQLELALGDGMGQWDEQEIFDLVMLQSGVYEYTDHTMKKHTRVRGFHSRVCLQEVLEANLRVGTLKIPCGIPNTLLYALQRDRQINEIGNFERNLDLNADQKRVWSGHVWSENILAGMQSSKPHQVREV